MIKKFCASSLLVSASISFAFAQESTNSSNNFKHDIGFNTSFILDGILNTGGNSLSLLYKTYGSDHTAWRFGINGSFRSDKNSADSVSGPQAVYTAEYSTVNLEITIGREFQKPINQKWTWYYGVDLIPFYSLSEDKTFFNYTAPGAMRESENTSYGLQLRSFLAIRFNINERLYLSAEASARVGYSRRSSYTSAPDYQNALSITETQGHGVFFSASPASGIFLNYRF